MTSPSLAGAYFIAQAVAIGLWWVLLLALPSSRVWFLPDGFSETSLLAFGLADAVAAFSSGFGGALAIRGSRRCRPFLWLTSGAMAYGALYCVGALVLAGGPWLSTLMMIPAAILSIGGAWLCSRD